MKALGNHQGNFTWARNAYNKSDDPETQDKFTKYMAKYLREGQEDGFNIDQITRGLAYPSEVDKYVSDITTVGLPAVSDDQAKKEIAESVDTTNVSRMGHGTTSVYVYGYACCPDRLKIGYATNDAVQRISDQIGTGTPDKPMLHIEIKTDDCRALERAIHAVLRFRGRKVVGGGDEWFKATKDEIVEIYEFIRGPVVVDLAAN